LDVISGSLPDGIALKPNGELYGMPTTVGTYTFTVKISNSDRNFADSTRTFTLTVRDNTNANVFTATDTGYQIVTPVGISLGQYNYFVEEIPDEGVEFKVAGEYDEFIDLWLNGEVLVEGIDYVAEDGSTVITIQSQTFENKANQTGRNTLAAEFRVDGNLNNDLKRASQNFTLDGSTESGTGGTTGGTTGGGGGGGGGGAATTPPPPPADNTPVVTPLPATTAEVSEPTAEQNAAAAEAVASVISSGAENNVTITQAGDPVAVSGGSSPTVTTISGADTGGATVMAIVNDDGTLTPVPTKINEDGTVTVLITGDVVLVPLKVEPDFNDVASNYWGADEINKAAALMIVQGTGGGDFNPKGEVTGAEAVTMFLRAMGLPIDGDAPAVGGVNQNAWYADAINTAAANGLTTSIDPDVPMSRMQAAELIYSALDAIGMNPNMTVERAKEVLAGFTDLGHLTDEQLIMLGILVELGIFKGNGNGTMTPDEVLQRVHMASLAVRFQELILELSL